MFDAVGDKLIGIFESIFMWMFDSFIQPFLEIPTLKNLVFGRTDKDTAVWGTFRPSELTDALGPMFNTMAVLSGFFLVAFIVFYGIRISGAPLNPSRRNEMIEFFKDILIVGVVLVNLPTLYDLLFQVNSAFVGLFSGAYDNQSIDRMNNIGKDFIGNEEEGPGNAVMGVLGLIFVQLILLGLMLWANFYYMMRKITLLILMALGPLMMVFYLHPQFKPITAAWIKELTGSIFVQSIHAFVFWTVATISTQENGFVGTVIVYLVFIPISESVRRLFNMGGDMQGGLAKAGAMLGMAGLAGMAGSVKGALDGQSVMGALKGAYSGVKKGKGLGSGTGNGETGDDLKSTLGANAGADNGTTPRAEKMLRAGDIMGKMGKATFGMAGAVAGSALGPVGAMMGASGGFAAGGVVGGVTGRAGMAALQAIPNRLSKGKEAWDAKDSKNGEFGENLANEMADRDTTSWANSNEASVKKGLKEKFPDLSAKDIDAKFDEEKAKKREGFYTGAKAKFSSAADYAKGKASGDDLVAASSQGMADAWGDENQKDFFDNYDKKSPKRDNESQLDYYARRMTAFNKKKSGMRDAFAEKGQQYVAGNAADGQEPIDKEAFNNHMKQAVQGVPDVGNVEAITQGGQSAVSKVQGAQLFNKNGKPNKLFLAGSMANAKTQEMEQAFVSSQEAGGVPKEVAQKDWNQNHKQQVHAENLSNYKDSVDSADGSTYSIGAKGVAQRVGQKAVQTLAFAGATTGVSSGFGLVPLLRATSDGVGAGVTRMMVGEDGQPTGNKILQIIPATKAAFNTGINTLADEQGGAVNAQANFQNKVGYTAGIFTGTTGYQASKKLASKISPYKQQTQEAIQSVSEVIQMAQTTTDDHGNVTIAPGAVRQVTTPNESYIEVRTKSGDTQVVSRKGSGHTGLKKGEVVYQDLEAKGDTLVVSSSNGSPSSTYRMDSGGGKVPSSVNIESHPSTLLGNPSVGKMHKPQERQHVPIFNQAVDSGKFYVSDISDQGMENVQVVVEKDRQFVTAQKGGETYRVSPIYAGDTRLGSSETVQIPVEVKNQQLVPNQSPGSKVAVQSIIQTTHESYDYDNKDASVPYYSTQEVKTLVPSRHSERAHQSIGKRSELDTVRRKQGLLG
ncbi:MAG: type IV secretion system protein [Paenisporosarcina sp.]|nr:type IV secretion system protein [Paenisporosarcina sp.]